jgi:hypothetical protein
LIKAKKPLIGHNMLYDVLYLYQQFVADLPDTFLEFREKWVSLFPMTFDTKVLTSNSGHFHRTDLGKAYEKCSLDGKMKASNCKVQFDENQGFLRYGSPAAQKEERLQEAFYHEAAYDAYMTGFVFIQTLRFCEKRETKGGKVLKKKVEEVKEEEEKSGPKKGSQSQISW